MAREEIIKTFQLFWNKGIKQVSPGVLGMTMLTVQRPLSDGIAKNIADGLPFARWDGTWIVLEREPEA